MCACVYKVTAESVQNKKKNNKQEKNSRKIMKENRETEKYFYFLFCCH